MPLTSEKRAFAVVVITTIATLVFMSNILHWKYGPRDTHDLQSVKEFQLQHFQEARTLPMCASSLGKVTLQQWRHFAEMLSRSHVANHHGYVTSQMSLLEMVAAVKYDTHPLVKWKEGLGMSKHNQKRYMRPYRYQVTLHLNVAMKRMEYVIKEWYRKASSHGGASFRFAVQGRAMFYHVNTVDHFNGTYTACSPIPKECSQISISVLYNDYNAYVLTYPLENVSIFKQRWCPRQRVNDTAAKYLKHVQERRAAGKCRHVKFGKYAEKSVYMSKYDGRLTNASRRRKWTPVVEDCMLPVFRQDKIWKCMVKSKGVTFIGDSHLRYTYYYILKGLGWLKPTAPQRTQYHHIGKVHFLWADCAHRIPGLGGFVCLDDVLNNITANYVPPTNGHTFTTQRNITEHWTISPGDKPLVGDVIIMNVGVHHHCHDTVQSMLRKFSALFETLRQIKTDKVFQKTRLIWWTMVAFGYGHHNLTWKINPTDKSTCSLRNNYIGAAMNEIVVTSVREIGFEVFDAFQYSFFPPGRVGGDMVCHHHWLCRSPYVGDGNVVVSNGPGHTTLDALLGVICS